jgi:hypothetical protein
MGGILAEIRIVRPLRKFKSSKVGVPVASGRMNLGLPNQPVAGLIHAFPKIRSTTQHPFAS